MQWRERPRRVNKFSISCKWKDFSLVLRFKNKHRTSLGIWMRKTSECRIFLPVLPMPAIERGLDLIADSLKPILTLLCYIFRWLLGLRPSCPEPWPTSDSAKMLTIFSSVLVLYSAFASGSMIERRAIQTQAVCLPDFNWMATKQQNNSPCLVVAQLGAICNNGSELQYLMTRLASCSLF